MLKLSPRHLTARKVIIRKFYLTVIVNTVIVLQGVIQQACRKLNQTSQACGEFAHFTLSDIPA